MAGEIAAAYVSLIPSFQGGSSAIARELGGPAATAGADAGDRFGTGFGDAVRGMAATGALFGGVAVLATAFDAALTQADLPAALASQFGLAEGAAAEAAGTAAAVYAAGWGSSLGEVGTAVGEVTRQLEQLGQTGDVEALTQQAQALADRFGQDVGEAITTASQMVKTGLAPDMTSAMDIMVAGFQSGADSGQDLLDTLTEYSTKFRDLGIDGATAMGLINQGMTAGARNSDVLGDALKEFSIRAIDGSETTAAGFEALGLSVDEMAATFAAGGPEAAAALDLVLDRLRDMEDPVARDAAAVQLFGTYSEDLGDALYALDPSEATAALGEFTGAASEVANATGESATAQLAAFGRTFTTGLAEHITPLLPQLQSLVSALLPLTPILIGLAVAVGLAAVAMGLWRVVVIAARVVMIGWRIAVIAATVVQWAWYYSDQSCGDLVKLVPDGEVSALVVPLGFGLVGASPC